MNFTVFGKVCIDMTIPEAEAYRTAIIRTAVDWAHGEHTIDQLELRLSIKA